jgi:NADH-quinone oxidoreductase subunit H
MLNNIFLLLLQIILLILPLLLAVAFLTLVERKVLAAMQRRTGPNYVGILGLFQPIADAAKLIFKETVFPRTANIFLFILAPVSTFFLSLSGWAVIPFNESFVISDINLGIFYLFAISSLNVYGIIIARLGF